MSIRSSSSSSLGVEGSASASSDRHPCFPSLRSLRQPKVALRMSGARCSPLISGLIGTSSHCRSGTASWPGIFEETERASSIRTVRVLPASPGKALICYKAAVRKCSIDMRRRLTLIREGLSRDRRRRDRERWRTSRSCMSSPQSPV